MNKVFVKKNEKDNILLSLFPNFHMLIKENMYQIFEYFGLIRKKPPKLQVTVT